MDTGEILRELERVYKSEKKKVVPTFSLNLCMMLEDVIPKIQKLKELEEKKRDVYMEPSTTCNPQINEDDEEWDEIFAFCGDCGNLVGKRNFFKKWERKNFCDQCGCEVDWRGIDNSGEY